MSPSRHSWPGNGGGRPASVAGSAVPDQDVFVSDPLRPRLEPLPVDEWDDFLQRLLAASPGGLDRPLHIFTTLARNPTLFRRWIAFGGALLDGEIRPRDRELVILRVAHLTESSYERAQHVPLALAVGVTEDEVAGLRLPIDEERWPAHDAVLLHAVDQLHHTGTIDDLTWDALHQSLGDSGVIELLMLVGQYQLVALVLRTLRIRIEGGT